MVSHTSLYLKISCQLKPHFLITSNMYNLNWSVWRICISEFDPEKLQSISLSWKCSVEKYKNKRSHLLYILSMTSTLFFLWISAASAWENWRSWFTMDCSSSNSFSWESGEIYLQVIYCEWTPHPSISFLWFDIRPSRVHTGAVTHHRIKSVLLSIFLCFLLLHSLN